MSYKYYFEKVPFEINISYFLDTQFGLELPLRQDLISIRPHPESDQICMEFHNEITAQDKLDIQLLVDEHDCSQNSEYKIKDLINPEFINRPIENIDFKRHSKADIALAKESEMLPDGRPSKSKYYYNTDDLIADIEFEFVTDSDNLITERKEWLTYYKKNGQPGKRALIKHFKKNPANTAHHVIVAEEKVASRSNIINALKIELLGILQQALSQTVPQIIQTVTPFWNETEVARKNFIELGSDDFKDEVSAIDLATTSHTWLSIPIDQNGTTIKDYIIARLTY